MLGTFAKHLIKTRRDGKRVEIPPGERLPDWMPAHDVAELVAIGAATDVPDEAESIAASAVEAGAAGGASAGTNTTSEGSGAAPGDSPGAGTVIADPASEIPCVVEEAVPAAVAPLPELPDLPAAETPAAETAKPRAKK
ncbi:MAG: hypothetical protein AzoDbin1_05146 [Azoarcus sp.]|nr:hypothetical protein [Azoarcus sp.]